MIKKSLKLLVLLLIINHAFFGGSVFAGDVKIIDTRHYSSVFGEIRNFRIFLPPGYGDNPLKKYPVIYYYHGWSQRYFGSGPDDYASIDRGDDNKGDNIANFVASHDVIVVKPDGYNRRVGEEYYVRPYNVSPVETYRQFPLYFPELVDYVDANYNTLADRNHRAISGLSMGGFMCFMIGGKYPHLISSIGNFCGSPEFIIGPYDMPDEYKHINMYDNYAGINVRLNYGNEDFIRYYHSDMNRIWTQVMDNYEYKVYPAAHSTCGLGDMFGFIMKTFDNPPQKPVRWDHIDVYPEFSVWDYKVSSDRDIPGFTILENVDQRGFRCSVREHLPDGEMLSCVSLSVTTPGIYDPNSIYTINDIDIYNLNAKSYSLKSDNAGRLKIFLNGKTHEIGINKNGDKPDISLASFSVNDGSLAELNKDVTLNLKLLNKGMIAGEGIKVYLTAFRKSASISRSMGEFGTISSNETRELKGVFTFRVNSDSIEIEKFLLTIKDKHDNEWKTCFEIPLIKNLPEIKDFEIADGRRVIVAKGGVDTDTIVLGSGNGDGVANPGESIVVLAKEKNKLWRTELISSDKFVNPYGKNIRVSDDWGSYDYVGGSAKYSVPLISSDCPDRHVIGFAGEYWLPDKPNHIIRQCRVNVMVTGKDVTAPVLQWARNAGDNVIQARIYDGSVIKNVKAKLTLKDKPEISFEVELKDDGLNGDRVPNDNVFSYMIPEKKFGLYLVEVSATDSFGNSMTKKCAEIYTLH